MITGVDDAFLTRAFFASFAARTSGESPEAGVSLTILVLPSFYAGTFFGSSASAEGASSIDTAHVTAMRII